MNIMQINVNTGHRYFVRAKLPDGDQMAAPTIAGSLTGLRARFTETKGGAAIDADLDNLAATEDGDEPDLFYVDVSQALHQAHLLPLGRGTKFYVTWSKVGVADYLTDTFVVATGTDV